MVATTRLRERIQFVREAVAQAAELANRDPTTVTLIAVSKTVDRPSIDDAVGLGVRHFGENRVRDALAKFERSLADDVTLHLIGQLQTNKVRDAVKLFDLIHSVDRRSLIEALAKEGARAGQLVPILIQVNVAGEAQKAGCTPEEVDSLLSLARASPHLSVRGLMTIAPLVTDAEQVRPVFRRMREIRDALEQDHEGMELPTLSMGMSNDFAVAVEEGATHVRLGRAIFG